MAHLYKVVVRYLEGTMAHVFTDNFLIEMFQADVAGVLEKSHDEHQFLLEKC